MNGVKAIPGPHSPHYLRIRVHMKNKTDIENQLVSIIQQLLTETGNEYSQRTINLDTALQQHLGIDSFGRAELLHRIEKNFNIQLPDNLIAEANTIRDLVDAIYSTSPTHITQQQEIHQHKLDKSHINPEQAKTLIDVLLLYAKGDPERPHIYFQDEKGKEEVINYGTLFENSLRVAQAIQKRGIQPGDTVAIMQPTNLGFFYTFFGILLANCIPVPIYPPFRPQQIESYAKQEAKILQNAEARLLVTFHEAEQLSKLLRAFIPSLKEVTTVSSLIKNEEKAPIPSPKPDDFALIQYTSGSTSAPKGVLLTHQNLLANIRAYGEAIQVTPNDVAVSWAPLYHDLGLIGMWLGSLFYGIPLVLMSPLTFLNRPERWLWAIHHHRGTISGGPNFSYELCVNKIDPDRIKGLDLSSWRLAPNGAEPIQPNTLRRFTEKFAPYGFKPETHFPVYGLAESTVCVATSPLNRLPRIERIDRKAFEEQRKAIPTENKTEQNSIELVSSGKPIPHHEVRIVDENNQVLPERHIGQIQFKGPSSMQGYYGNPKATMAIYHDGWWDTGDLAYLADEEIFITGRKKDVIIKAGRNLYPSEVEDLSAQAEGVRTGCVIAFGTTDPQRGTEKLFIIAETREKKPVNPEKIIQEITDKIVSALDVAPDKVILVPPHTIPKTSSGKLQRAACKASYLSGKLKTHHTPFWLQLTKISLNFGFIKMRQQLANLGKFFYSLYAAMIISLTLMPIYLILWILPYRAAAQLCKIWARSLFFLVFCPIEIYEKSNLKKQHPVIFVANHASYIDGMLLMSLLPAGTRIIGKEELIKTPILRFFVKKLRYIPVNRTDASKGLEDAKVMEQVLREGHSIAIFPEGTFGYGVGLRPFKLGAFKLATETHTAICPIAIEGTRSILRGGEFLLKPGKIKIHVGELIMPAGTEWHDTIQLKNHVRSIIAKDCGEPTLDLITPEIVENG